jgi:hypothetical protein
MCCYVENFWPIRSRPSSLHSSSVGLGTATGTRPASTAALRNIPSQGPISTRTRIPYFKLQEAISTTGAQLGVFAGTEPLVREVKCTIHVGWV